MSIIASAEVANSSTSADRAGAYASPDTGLTEVSDQSSIALLIDGGVAPSHIAWRGTAVQPAVEQVPRPRRLAAAQ